MKSRYAVLIICTFILISQLTGQVVKYNDTFTLYYTVRPDNGIGTWGAGPNTEGRVFLKGRYKDSLPEGKWLFYDLGGVNISSVQNYKKGKLNDTFYKYHYNGQVTVKGRYSDNLKTGTWYKYQEINGQILETTFNYVNDTLHGWQKGWEEDIYFENGKVNGPYYKKNYKGDTIIKGQYVKNSREGQWFVKDPAQTEYAFSILNYTNNLLHDTCYYFNKDSVLIKKVTYNRGSEDGPAYYYGKINYGDSFLCANCTKIIYYRFGHKREPEIIINATQDTLYYSGFINGSAKGLFFLKDEAGTLRHKMTYDWDDYYNQVTAYEEQKWDAKGKIREWSVVKSEYSDVEGEFYKKWDSIGKLVCKDTVYKKNGYLKNDFFEYNKGKLIREEHWYNHKRDGRWFKKGEYDVIYKSGKIIKTISGKYPVEDIVEVVEDGSNSDWDIMLYSEDEKHDPTDRINRMPPDDGGSKITVPADVNPKGFKGQISVKIYLNIEGYAACARIVTPVDPELDAIAMQTALKSRFGFNTNAQDRREWREIVVLFQ